MAKSTKSGKRVYTTDDIKKLGISRELNAKYEREGLLPAASIERAAGPWRAALYSEGDLMARLLMKRLTGRGLSLKVAGWILNNARFIGETFDEGELDGYRFIAFPVFEKKQLDPKANPDSQPFNEWAELDELYKHSKHEAFIVLDIEKIREEVKNLK